MLASTPLTRHATRAIVLTILGTVAFLVVRYEFLPWLLPVHFRRDGVPDGWQYRTLARVMMPAFVQLALALTLGGTCALLLSHRTRGDGPPTPDAKAARVAAEAVMLIALIWVAFQGYAAAALVGMWTTERGGLGWPYIIVELIGIVMTGVVGVRAHVHLGHPAPLPYVSQHWRLGQLYCNANHPALFVPTRDGSRWTLNFGRPAAVALLSGVLLAGVALPTLILVLALRF